MTPEERALAVVDKWRRAMSTPMAQVVVKDITKALRDYGDERLEEAAVLGDLKRNRPEGGLGPLYRAGWIGCGEILAREIRARKQGNKPKETEQ